MTEDVKTIINDITGLNPIQVNKIITPATIEEIRQAVIQSQGPVSVAGGHFSMGGQIGTENSLHIDMRQFNQIISFHPETRTIRVQAGIRWREIQHFIDQHQLAVMIMQTYSNFTVGGSLSVNVHGRYIGHGPLILSVREIKLVLANGEVIDASPTQNQEIFYGAIGGYGGLGVIVEAVLELAPNTKIEQQQIKLDVSEYRKYFFDHVRANPKAIFHNADLYPSHYTKARAITWLETDKELTIQYRLIQPKTSYAIERYFVWAITSTPLGKWRREYIIDPLLYMVKRITWRNYEASSYDVKELEPWSRKRNTYVLQEYFIPVMRFDEYLAKMREILQRYNVNALNISVRHAHQDPGSLLAWAREEVFAFVLYYKQATSRLEKNKIAVWTRELIDAAIAVGGSYYLPYQLHATRDQFHKAYPRAKELFALKKKLDPDYKFRNKLWDKYYSGGHAMSAANSEFKAVFNDPQWRDRFYLFLQNVYNIYPENEFHALIREASDKHESDKEIYGYLQKKLPEIKPFLADFRYAIPALIKQKKEMARQTMEMIKDSQINGYLEIGSTGRYISQLRKHYQINGPIYLLNDKAPDYSPVEILERGQLKKIGTYIPVNNYDSITPEQIPDNSLDIVTCYVGMHHVPLDKLDGFIKSIHRVLRNGGKFIVRDHDVDSENMRTFVSLVHTVFNAGLNVSWDENCNELRYFTSVNNLTDYLEKRGFKSSGIKLLQEHDPSMNTLLEFTKVA